MVTGRVRPAARDVHSARNSTIRSVEEFLTAIQIVFCDGTAAAAGNIGVETSDPASYVRALGGAPQREHAACAKMLCAARRGRRIETRAAAR